MDAHRARSFFPWLLLMLLVRIPLLLGPAGLGFIAVRAARDLPTSAVYLAFAAAVVSSLWLSLIAEQIVQNSVTRFFGAEAKPIRWWAGDQGKRHRGRKRRKA